MRKLSLVLLTVLCTASTVTRAFASTPSNASPAAEGPCPRYVAGSRLIEPKNLFSRYGILRVRLRYQTRVDSSGNTLYCFTSADGSQSPTLHVQPGDELLITLVNELPPAPPMAGMSAMDDQKSAAALPAVSIEGHPSPSCGAMVMTASSVNIHYHGTNVAPVCHQDEVIKTMINSGEAFEYDIHFPLNEPPGLYWYHPHIHGISEAAVQGGASGAIVVEGIENVTPEVAGLPQRILIVRDNVLPGTNETSGEGEGPGDTDPPDVPAWDLSLNYIPVAFPDYTPVTIPMASRQRQFWRVLNASADTILNLQVQYDGAPQPLRVIALDGVPTGSQDGTTGGHPIRKEQILLPPAGRAEFIIDPPGPLVKSARLLTLNVDTGPDGDNDPQRPLAVITTRQNAGAQALLRVPEVSGPPVARARFQALRSATPTVHRKLYFSEVLSDPNDPNSPTNFFITVDGQTPKLFSPANPPSIVTTQGSVEDWTIENRALENHEFHIHQIHFLTLEQNHVPVEGDYLDTINVPYWSGEGPYPSVKLRMDFRGDVVGDFVYHCHILGHEDSGMMATIRVLPRR
ncbi:MAG TPA: multicopper oxidase domain-containing protein [Acidisarcina sp.]